jgi:hypothetical protein
LVGPAGGAGPHRIEAGPGPADRRIKITVAGWLRFPGVAGDTLITGAVITVALRLRPPRVARDTLITGAVISVVVGLRPPRGAGDTLIMRR